MNIVNFNKIQKILHFFVLIFPLVIILRSAAVNIVLVVISIISIIYIITKKNNFFFQDNLIKLIIIFFGFVFINSLIQFQNTETVLKTLANYRYLLLTFGVFITLQNLPSKIRRQLSLLYLLARIADTIADSSEGETKWLKDYSLAL